MMRASTALAFAALMAVASPVRAQNAAAADHQFLHEMADLNSGVALLAHETLHRAGTFPSKTDAASVDKQHDDDMDHIRAALTMLNDSYRAKASHADSAAAAALSTKRGAAYDAAFRSAVRALDQREVKSVDTYVPQLTNSLIKTLAGRMRASAEAEAKSLGG